MASCKSSETFGSKPQSQVAAVRVSTLNIITKPPSHLLKFSAKFWYVRPNLNTQSLVTKQQTANYNTYVNNEEAQPGFQATAQPPVARDMKFRFARVGESLGTRLADANLVHN